ncbi:MAG: hypothetical protein DYG89_30410 [Caldilinea sp. CFX5]|nr:hypothetical protein [Caldilinea sp. CFX5]
MHPATCDTGGWTGWTPTLALPTTGEPVVAYDAVYVAHCFADGAWHDEALMRTARLVVFTQP